MPSSAPPTLTVFTGEGGYTRFADGGGLSVPRPREFRAAVRSAHIDGLHLSEWSVTPISGSVMPTRVRPAVVLIAVLEGELEYEATGHRCTLTPGHVLIVDTSKRLRFSTRAPMRLLRIVVPAARVPLLSLDGVIGAETATPLSHHLMSLTEIALTTTRAGTLPPASRAIPALTIATLEEVATTTTTPDQRTQIIDYIERNLSNPELCPTTIADAFGFGFRFSLRWVHQLFNVGDESVARHIRLRRLEVVAAHLAADRRFPKINVLAQRNGFTSRDALTRAFKSRYGMSIADYAALAHEGRTPTPLVSTTDPAEWSA